VDTPDVSGSGQNILHSNEFSLCTVGASVGPGVKPQLSHRCAGAPAASLAEGQKFKVGVALRARVVRPGGGLGFGAALCGCRCARVAGGRPLAPAARPRARCC